MNEYVDTEKLLEMTATIVAAHVGNVSTSVDDIPGIVKTVYGALDEVVSAPPIDEDEQVIPPRPAVPIKKSITPDYLVCLEDGKKFKSLNRHLNAKYGLSPEEYKEKWNLPADYPMVAPAYAEARSRLAKKMGLDKK